MNIELRERNEETVRTYFEKTNTPPIRKMLPQKAMTLEEALSEYRRSILPGLKSFGKTIWIDGKYTGDIWCYSINNSDIPNAMLSFCIFERELWGKGTATEAVRTFLPIICEKFGLVSVGAFAFTNNTASIKVLRKNGFQIKEEFIEDGISSVYMEKFLSEVDESHEEEE